MPAHTRARIAIAVLLIVVTMAGIQSVGPVVGPVLPGRGLLLAVGISAEVVLASLLIALHWHRAPAAARTGSGQVIPDHDIGSVLRRILSRVLIALLIALPLAYLLSRVQPRFRQVKRRAQPVSSARGHPRLVPAGTYDLALLRYVLLGVLILALAVGLIWLWLRRRQLRWLPRPDSPADEPIAAPADDLARAVQSGRDAIREVDDARAAIIACYAAMEESLARAGAGRAAAETPDELLARAIDDGMVAVRPARRLTGLFYEARFSSHPVPEASREQAVRALAELAATLPGQDDSRDIR
ncbi:MAG: DUF4129 domain-containing protein [Streptosporangiaceae bacterium]